MLWSQSFCIKPRLLQPITNQNKCWDLGAYAGSHCSLKTSKFMHFIIFGTQFTTQPWENQTTEKHFYFCSALWNSHGFVAAWKYIHCTLTRNSDNIWQNILCLHWDNICKYNVNLRKFVSNTVTLTNFPFLINLYNVAD